MEGTVVIASIPNSDNTERSLQLFNDLFNNMTNTRTKKRMNRIQEIDELEEISSPKSDTSDNTSSPLPKAPSSTPNETQTNNSQLDSLSEFQQMLRDGIQRVEKTKTEIHKREMESSSRVEKLQAELQTVKNEFSTIRDECNKEISVKNDEIKLLIVQKQNLESELKNVKTSSAIQLAEKQTLVMELEKQIRLLREENVAVRQPIIVQPAPAPSIPESVLFEKNRQLTALQSAVDLLNSEVEEWKFKFTQLEQLRNDRSHIIINTGTQHNHCSPLDQKEGEIKILRARLDSEREEINVLRTQLQMSKKKEEDIRKEAFKEVEKLKIEMAFKDHEMKNLQLEYNKLLEPPGTPERSNDDENESDSDGANTTPKKRKLMKNTSPLKKMPPKKLVLNDEEEEAMEVDSTKSFELKTGPQGLVKITLEPL